MNIIELMFANDLLVFANGDYGSMNFFMITFMTFLLFLGYMLKFNLFWGAHMLKG